MTAAQRTNAKYDRIWEEYRRLEREKLIATLSKELNAVPGELDATDREWAKNQIAKQQEEASNG